MITEEEFQDWLEQPEEDVQETVDYLISLVYELYAELHKL